MATKQQLIEKLIRAAQDDLVFALWGREGADVIAGAAKTGRGWADSAAARSLLVMNVRRALRDAATSDSRRVEYYQCWEALTVEGLRRILAFIENQSDNRNEDN